jgi:hypothetical protein
MKHRHTSGVKESALMLKQVVHIVTLCFTGQIVKLNCRLQHVYRFGIKYVFYVSN